jgi:hypothetical protein
MGMYMQGLLGKFMTRVLRSCQRMSRRFVNYVQDATVVANDQCILRLHDLEPLDLSKHDNVSQSKKLKAVHFRVAVGSLTHAKMHSTRTRASN